VISLIPQHAKAMIPPRVLAVPFILGRPLGVPEDADFQHRVLDAALGLLERTDGPVYEEYEEDAPSITQEDEAWSCPVSFAKPNTDQSLSGAVMSEITLLKPWYDKGIELRGKSTFGLAGLGVDEVVELISNFASDAPPTDKSSIAQLKLAAEDLKAFYNEAATAQPGTSNAQEIEDWYWQSSSAGRLIRSVVENCTDSDDGILKLTANLLLVPASQQVTG
jgi:hypothetical protein